MDRCEVSQSLSDTLRYISLVGLVTGLVDLSGPIHLCPCVSEEGGDGEGPGSQTLSDTLRCISLAGLTIGLVTFRGPIDLCVCVSEECFIDGVVCCESMKREVKIFPISECRCDERLKTKAEESTRLTKSINET